MSVHKRSLILIALGVIVLGMIGCGGSSDPVSNQFIGAGENPPGIVGTLSGETGQVTYPDLQPIEGQLGSAPLGTNPKYNVQEAESVIETHKVSATSSLGRSASQDGENSVLWVSIVPHGEDPIPSASGGPFEEGDQVDLYMRYNVDPGKLTIERSWIIEACGLRFTDTYTHPEPGTYEAIFPFILPYGSASMEAVFTGIVSLPTQVSVITLSGYEGYAQVGFEIEYVPVLPPVYLPTELPGDTEGPHPCMPDWDSLLVFADLHVESTDKVLGNVTYVFDKTWGDLGDEIAVQFAGLTGFYFDPDEDNGQHYDGPWPPDNPNLTQQPFTFDDVSIVFVKAGCNSSGFGPGYGWRYDAPFAGDGYPDTNELPTAQILVEETVPVLGQTLPEPDYDYNDFAGTYRAVEIYKDPPGDSNNNGLLVQINLTVYAQACSVDFPKQWQLNVEDDMPLGTKVQALVQLFNNKKEPKPYYSDQFIYYSESGFSTPLFTPLDNALVYPTDYDSVNCDAVNPVNFPQFVEGDWAEVTLTLLQPVGTGGYDPWPYVPVMWISPDGENAWSVDFWKEKGDELNADGMPQAMLLPDTFTWPLEGIHISDVYDSFDTWIAWLNDPEMFEPLYPWYEDDPYADENPDPPGGIQPATWEAFSMDKFTP